jgi:hypothetical protein
MRFGLGVICDEVSRARVERKYLWVASFGGRGQSPCGAISSIANDCFRQSAMMCRMNDWGKASHRQVPFRRVGKFACQLGRIKRTCGSCEQRIHSMHRCTCTVMMVAGNRASCRSGRGGEAILRPLDRVSTLREKYFKRVAKEWLRSAAVTCNRICTEQQGWTPCA